MPISFLIFCLIGAAGGFFWYYQQSYQRIALKVTDKEIIQVARDNGGRITATDLVENTDLTISEANLKIQQLLNNGILRYKLTNNFKVVYELDSSIQYQEMRAIPRKIQKPKPSSGKSDGDIIALAVKSKGKISAAGLCMKSSISIDEAEERLKFLQEKGVFDIEVSDHGTVLYTIIDQSLLE